jgi:predicted Fe-Mo cluster-binding NifX family protein
MKIAVFTEDGKTISQHFGRARYYLVFTIEAGVVQSQELREKAGHASFSASRDENHARHSTSSGHGFGSQATSRHMQMIANLRDCHAVIGGGMGQGAYQYLQENQIAVCITDLSDPTQAVLSYLDGSLANHLDWLH